MIAKRFDAIWFLALVCLLFTAPAFAQSQAVNVEARSTGLEEAIAIAFESSLSLRAAELDLTDARIGLQQAEANNLIQPSPTSLIQAERRLSLAERGVLLARYDVKLAVEESYYGVLRAENLLGIAREALELAERQLAIAEERHASGAQTRADVLAAASRVAKAMADVAQAEAGYDLALLAFRRTLGVPFDAPIVPAGIDLEFTPVTPDLEADLAFALAHRIEVLQAQTGIDAARKQVELSTNDYTPALALQAAEVALAKALNQYEQLRSGIELEIRQAHAELSHAGRRIAALVKGVEEAEENLRVARRLFEVNTAPLTQVMGAEVALAQARTEHVHAVFDYNLARARYDRAVARPFAEGGSQ